MLSDILYTTGYGAMNNVLSWCGAAAHIYYNILFWHNSQIVWHLYLPSASVDSGASATCNWIFRILADTLRPENV